MSSLPQRWFQGDPVFDPSEGVRVVAPPATGAGHWSGACSVLRDDRDWFLYYRLRRPRGQTPDRGYECRIAQSRDGISFRDVWRVEKTALDTTSMERSCLARASADVYRLYVSYVDPADQRWRIDVMEASSPDRFDTASRRPALTAAMADCEGVKDPWVFRLGDRWLMVLSYARSRPDASARERSEMHSSADVYNTGITKSCTGLASSEDGLHWAWQGDIFSPGETGWDCFCRRIGGLVWAPPLWIAFYDGTASVRQNYEERTGLAAGADLRALRTVSPDGPCIGTATGPGGVRYVEPVAAPGEWRFYYEYGLPDGSHELRLSIVRGR